MGGYSFLGLSPDLIWRCHGDHVEINRQALKDPNAFEDGGTGALASLRALIEEGANRGPAANTAADGLQSGRLYGL